MQNSTHFQQYLKLTTELLDLANPDNQNVSGREIKHAYLIGAVIFLAMSMEAFINDFGRKFVDDFESLERIPAKDKYVIFPKFTQSGHSLIVVRDQPDYNALDRLFDLRNHYAHDRYENKNNYQLEHQEITDLQIEMIRILIAFQSTYPQLFDSQWSEQSASYLSQ